MTIMICNAMLTYPLTFGDEYAYDGLGNILAVLIVCVPLTFIPVYAFYRIYVTKGKNLKEVGYLCQIYSILTYWFFNFKIYLQRGLLKL